MLNRFPKHACILLLIGFPFFSMAQSATVTGVVIDSSTSTATLFLQQNFGNLLLKPRIASFRPELVLVQNISYRSLDHPEAHSGVILQAPEKGLFEKVCWSTISTV
jgi:hypothetical protein